MREASKRRHILVVDRIGASRVCRFDLHALVAEVADLLALGSDQADPSCASSFWSTDWSPWRAVEPVRRDWPALRFEMKPRYDAA